MNMERKSSFVVISDFRTTPLIAAISIARKKVLTGNVEIVVSSRTIYTNDYGDFIPTTLKLFKLFILRLFLKCTIVAEDSNTKVNDEFTLGIKSSLLSITCDSQASENTYPVLYSQLVNLSKGSIEVANFIINKRNNAEIYIFNGRLSSTYSITNLYKKNFDIYYYEYSSDPKKYVLYPFAIHDDYLKGLSLINYKNNILISKPILSNMSEMTKSAKLNNLYVSRYKTLSDKIFDVVVFLGSDHEYSHVSAPKTGTIAIGNLQLVKEVIKKYESECSIAVRAHPNQIFDRNFKTTNQIIEEICREKNITFYPPNSSVSSYDLISKSKIVAVDVSSIGFDAVYLGKPVDVFGNSCLKTILDYAPIDIASNATLLANYVAENMSISDFLFLERFEPVFNIINQIMLRVESVIYRKVSGAEKS